MAKFTLDIDCDNAAFTDDVGAEIARILADVGRKVSDGRDDGTCRDVNGNRVGAWAIARTAREEAEEAA